MKHAYFGSCIVKSETSSQKILNPFSCFCLADSEAEALGKALNDVRKVCPEPQYTYHSLKMFEVPENVVKELVEARR